MRQIRVVKGEAMGGGWIRFMPPPGLVDSFAIMGVTPREVERIDFQARCLILAEFTAFSSEEQRLTGGEAAELLWQLTGRPLQSWSCIQVDCDGVHVGWQGEAMLRVQIAPDAAPAGPVAVSFIYR